MLKPKSHKNEALGITFANRHLFMAVIIHDHNATLDLNPKK